MPICPKTNRLYIPLVQGQSPFIRREQFTDSSGNLCYRDVEVFPNSEEICDYDLSAAGFFPSVLYSEVKKTEVFTPIPDSNNFKRSMSLMLSTYRVTTNKTNSLLKAMPSGIYLRTFKENGKDITISYFNSTSQVASGNYTLFSEKIIDAKTARTLISNGEAYCDLGLRRELGLPNT